MSYLQLENGIDDFSKAVMSLWFRVPKASIDEAQIGPGPLPTLGAAISLVTFGKPQEKIIYDSPLTDVAVWHYTTPEGHQPVYDFPIYNPAGTDPVDPCYIGVFSQAGNVSLVFHIQTADQPPFANAQINRSRVDFVDVGLGNTLPTAPGSGWVSDQLDGKYHRATLIDNSFVYNAQPEYFQVVTKRGIITGDHWHHLLLSFDLAGYMSVGQPNPTSTCQLWYAIDDVDYRGADNLRPFRDTGDGMDDNNIVSNNVYTISGGAPGSALYENQFVPPATGTYGPAIVPSSDAALGLPASAAYVDRIYAVEMAELQVFTGVSLDTKDEASRRAFITKDGTPADPLKKPNPPPPVPLPAGWVPPLKGPQELLGKEADILLHGSGNWIAGNNTGKAIKLNEIGKPSAVPAENLVSTGSIVAYSPDPSLHGVQSPPPPKPAIQQHATVR